MAGLKGRRPSFRRIRIGPLSFDFLVRNGVISEATVRAEDSDDPLVIRWTNGTERNPDVVAWRMLSDLKVMADDWQRVLEMADVNRVEGPQRAILEDMVDWARSHRSPIVRAFISVQPEASGWRLLGARMGFAEGWVVTQDGETLKTGFPNDIEAMHWIHRKQPQSADWAIKYGGYDIVLVRDGKVQWSYKRDVLGREKKKKRGKGLSGRKDWDPHVVFEPLDLRVFLDSMIETALWAELDPHTEEPFDENYTPRHLTSRLKNQLERDAKDFMSKNWEDIKYKLRKAGHDFWLTRQGHGAGFWDGSWPNKVGERLTESANQYGEVTLIAEAGEVSSLE